MAKYIVNDQSLTAVADAIRAKAQITDTLTYPDEFIQAIDDIHTGVDTTDATATAADIRNGKTAYINEQKVTGTMTEKVATTYNVSTSNQTIDANQYLTGAQTIRKVTTANIAAGNIKSGVMISVGDEGSAGRIASVTGTFTASDTVSSGQTAAAAGQILSGYSAWVNGTEVKGSIGSKAAATYNTSTSDQSISASQYLSGAQTIKAVTTANISAGNIKTGIVVKVGDANSATRIANVTGTFTAANTVSTGQTAAAEGQILSGYSAWVDGAEKKGSIASLAATTYNTSASNQTIAAGKYLSGAQTIRAVTTANLSAANIKTGVTINVGDSADADRIAGVTGTFTATNTVSSGQTAAAAAQIRSGYSAWVGGNEIKGSIANLGATTYNTSTSDQTIAAGKYLSGAQTIRKVTTANISAANIKTGVTITVGDAGDADRIAGVAGTFTAANTVSSGQTAAAAAQIRSGYSAWVGGSEIKGSLANGSATTPATTITVAPSISIDSAGKITASNSGTKSVTPTVSAGYVSSGTAGTITVNGSNTKQMTVKAATTYNASTSDQSIAAGTYLTGAQTIRKITTANISAGNIKKGVTITVGDSGSSTRIANVTGTYAGSISMGTSGTLRIRQVSVYQDSGTSSPYYRIGTITSTVVSSIPSGTYYLLYANVYYPHIVLLTKTSVTTSSTNPDSGYMISRSQDTGLQVIVSKVAGIYTDPIIIQ